MFFFLFQVSRFHQYLPSRKFLAQHTISFRFDRKIASEHTFLDNDFGSDRAPFSRLECIYRAIQERTNDYNFAIGSSKRAIKHGSIDMSNLVIDFTEI